MKTNKPTNAAEPSEGLVSIDKVRDTEFHTENYGRVRDDISRCLRSSGCILPAGVIDALTSTALEEALSVRMRMAYMVETFIETFGPDVSANQLENLGVVLWLHRRDENNLGYMPQD